MVQIVVVVATLVVARLLSGLAGTTPGGAGAPADRAGGQPPRAGGRGRAAVWLTLAWTGLWLVLPLAVLALWSVRPAGPGSWTLAGYRTLGADVNGITPMSSAILSVTTASTAAVLAFVLGLNLAVASVDHGLRSESADEVRAVGAYATGLGLDFVPLAVEVSGGDSIQARARLTPRGAALVRSAEATLARGEVREFSSMYNEIRATALARLEHEARHARANAVVDVQIRMLPYGIGAVELLLTGTASNHAALDVRSFYKAKQLEQLEHEHKAALAKPKKPAGDGGAPYVEAEVHEGLLVVGGGDLGELHDTVLVDVCD